jgi:endonuclease/exonuclease/phosphatase (EEP) superfamily protein YafD
VPKLRLLSTNARTLLLDRSGLAALIAAESPDVVCVHGAPSALRWRSSCGAIARQAGLVVVCGGRTGGGNLVLSSLAVDVTASRDRFFAGSTLREPAGATVAALRRAGRPFAVVAGRVSGDAARRRHQADELQDTLADVAIGDPPAVLSVDGADRPGTSAWHALAQKRTPVGAGVFVDERIAIESRREIVAPTGAFAPVLVELSLPA